MVDFSGRWPDRTASTALLSNRESRWFGMFCFFKNLFHDVSTRGKFQVEMQAIAWFESAWKQL